MSRVEVEQMVEWANDPPEWQYAGLATSEDELEELREYVVTERKVFLKAAALRELGKRASLDEVVVPKTLETEPTVNFAELPLVRTISLRDCSTLATVSAYQDIMAGQRPKYDVDDFRRIWKAAAMSYGFLNCCDIENSKFSDACLKPFNRLYDGSWEEVAEERYQDMLEYAARDASRGYALQFMLQGVPSVQEACLNVDSLKAMLKNQQRRKEDNRYDMNHEAWKYLLKAKKFYDRKGPHKNKKTYADTVDELVPGLFSAPYMDPAIVASQSFVSIDDWRRATLAVNGNTSVSYLSMGFNTALSILTHGEWYRYGNRHSETDPMNVYGALFFDRQLLPELADVASSGKTKQRFILPVVEYLLDEQKDTKLSEDTEYLHIVFGEQKVSKITARVLDSL